MDAAQRRGGHTDVVVPPHRANDGVWVAIVRRVWLRDGVHDADLDFDELDDQIAHSVVLLDLLCKDVSEAREWFGGVLFAPADVAVVGGGALPRLRLLDRLDVRVYE